MQLKLISYYTAKFLFECFDWWWNKAEQGGGGFAGFRGFCWRFSLTIPLLLLIKKLYIRTSWLTKFIGACSTQWPRDPFVASCHNSSPVFVCCFVLSKHNYEISYFSECLEIRLQTPNNCSLLIGKRSEKFAPAEIQWPCDWIFRLRAASNRNPDYAHAAQILAMTNHWIQLSNLVLIGQLVEQ